MKIYIASSWKNADLLTESTVEICEYLHQKEILARP